MANKSLVNWLLDFCDQIEGVEEVVAPDAYAQGLHDGSRITQNGIAKKLRYAAEQEKKRLTKRVLDAKRWAALAQKGNKEIMKQTFVVVINTDNEIGVGQVGVPIMKALGLETIGVEKVAQPTLAGGRARVCPECDSEIAVCMMGHYCGEKTPAAKA